MTEKLEIRPEAREKIEDLLGATRQAWQVLLETMRDGNLSAEATEKVVENFMTILEDQEKSQDMGFILGISSMLVNDLLAPHRREMAAIQYRALPLLQDLTLDEYVYYQQQLENVQKENLIALDPIMQKLIMEQVVPQAIERTLKKKIGDGDSDAGLLGLMASDLGIDLSSIEVSPPPTTNDDGTTAENG